MSATRKIVINACHGGFSLSPAGVRRFAELQGRSCYFFVYRGSLDLTKVVAATEEEATRNSLFYAFDTPTPPTPLSGVAWDNASLEERLTNNAAWNAARIWNREIPRDDPFLIRVVEELGEKASGVLAELRIVEIPDNVLWEIDEYDGKEHVAEQHRVWR